MREVKRGGERKNSMSATAVSSNNVIDTKNVKTIRHVFFILAKLHFFNVMEQHLKGFTHLCNV